MNKDPVRVLVVDDSETTRVLLAGLISADPALRLAGAVHSGDQAVAFVRRAPPDIVLMDIHLGGMNGFEAARRIMETRPVPVVMCSAVTNVHEVSTAFRVYEAGAVALVEKPAGPGHPDHDQLVRELLQTLRLMAEVKVVRRWARPTVARPRAGGPAQAGRDAGLECVVVGASTGGPPALQTLLGGLDRSFPAPILIVQHISAGFLPGLCEWLSQTTGFQVHIAAHGIEPLPGHVYLAPDGLHLAIGETLRLRLDKGPMEHGLRPAIDHLFHSAAVQCGANAAGVLLTGMGRDGARGLLAMRERGAHTIAQDRASSVVYGMPGEAAALGAASQVLPIDRIAGALKRIERVSRSP